MLTIVLSGPASRLKAAQKALKTAGFQIALDPLGAPSDHRWGFADNVDGTKGKVPTQFLTVHGENHDLANEVAGKCGWQLRAHFEAAL